MIHFTCDLCGQDVEPNRDQHYVVKIEGYAVENDSLFGNEEFEEDHLEQISELLRDVDQVDDVEFDDSPKAFRFDLCPRCFKRFAQNPLNKDATQRFNFSEN